MTAPFVLLAGLVLLYLGAEWLVAGASHLALSLRVPQLVVGLTVVAFGTSAPEVVVSIKSSLSGHGDVALGNVLGSNVANLGLILGTSTLLCPAKVSGQLSSREVPVLLLSTLALALSLVDGRVSRGEGVALLSCAFMYTAFMVRGARREVLRESRERATVEAEAADEAGAPSPGGRVRQGLIATAGLGLLLVGGHLFVESATELARRFGMSEHVLGLTIVAVGTSLPELATSVIAAVRGHGDIALGNVVGSNIFNVLLCLPLAALTEPIVTRPEALLVDLGALALMTAMTAVFLRSERTFSRVEGSLLLACYAGFMGYLLMR